MLVEWLGLGRLQVGRLQLRGWRLEVAGEDLTSLHVVAIASDGNDRANVSEYDKDRI